MAEKYRLKVFTTTKSSPSTVLLFVLPDIICLKVRNIFRFLLWVALLFTPVKYALEQNKKVYFFPRGHGNKCCDSRFLISARTNFQNSSRFNFFLFFKYRKLMEERRIVDLFWELNQNMARLLYFLRWENEEN